MHSLFRIKKNIFRGGQRLHVLASKLVEPRNISCLLHLLTADRSNVDSKCIMAYQHMSARGAQYLSTTKFN